MNNCFKLSWRVSGREESQLLREFLMTRNISKAALTDIKFKGGGLYVNGDPVTVRYLLKAGDEIDVYFPPEEPSAGVKGESIPLNIVYEDEFLLVINKPAGMSTIPSREHPVGSLANGIIGYYNGKGLKATAHIVTRLDRDTSGLVLIAKHRHIHHLMSKLQKTGKLRRIYEAFVEGSFATDNGSVEAPIARKSSSIIEREVSENGQYAFTSYWVIKQFDEFSHLQLQLETGRTHQIRVHMSFIQHPLLGDSLYGGNKDLLPRQALHCREINFIHPIHQEKMKFIAPLPKDMENILIKSKPSL